MKIITVNSVSEYLRIVEENNLCDCISRGENQKFKSIRSSAVRPYDKSKPATEGKIYDFSVIQSYFDCVAGQITPLQAKHFLAFSQHHGLPTNLIDFSYSPLVSLYFACDNAFTAKRQSGKYGYVSFIRNERLVNVNSLINDNFQQNLLQSLFTFGSEYKMFEESVDINPLLLGINYYDTLVSNLDRFFDRFPNCINCEMINFALRGIGIDSFHYVAKEKRAEPVDRDYVSEQYDYIAAQVLKVMSSEFHSGSLADSFDKCDLDKIKASIDSKEKCLTTTEILFILLKYFSKLGIDNFYLPVYLTYTPPEIFNRISNQRSIFIYQLYADNSWNNNTMRREYPSLVKHNIIADKKELMPDYTFLFEQEIQPDYVIRVGNKAEILAFLDKLGVNLKTIYSDYDNVAKYLKHTGFAGR